MKILYTELCKENYTNKDLRSQEVHKLENFTCLKHFFKIVLTAPSSLNLVLPVIED